MHSAVYNVRHRELSSMKYTGLPTRHTGDGHQWDMATGGLHAILLHSTSDYPYVLVQQNEF